MFAVVAYFTGDFIDPLPPPVPVLTKKNLPIVGYPLPPLVTNISIIFPPTGVDATAIAPVPPVPVIVTVGADV